MEDNTQIKIWYDDEPDDIIARVNQALEKYNLAFLDDGEEHDGFNAYDLCEMPKK